MFCTDDVEGSELLRVFQGTVAGKIFQAKGEDITGEWGVCIMRSFMVSTFHQILLLSLSVDLLSQKMFADVACFCKLYVMTSLCSVDIIQRVKSV